MRILLALAFSPLALPALPVFQAQRSDTTRKDPTNTLPLETTRTVRFTTHEGTWMSVDVSPDGATIVFDLLGDLYTVPMTGGNATRIVGGNSVDVQPRYSPDGKSLAFTSDRSGVDATWIADADGKHPRLLTAGRACSSREWAQAQVSPPTAATSGTNRERRPRDMIGNPA